MKSAITILAWAVALGAAASAQAQSCGSGGGTTVCLSATGAAAEIQLGWTVSGAVTGLQVYRNTTSDPNGRQRLAVLGGTARNFTDSAALSGTRYWYWIKFTTTAGSYNSGGADASRVTGSGSANGWSGVKIGGGGYVPGLIFHPTTPNLLYARTDIGGAYRWNQATSAWIALTDGFGPQESFYVGAESMALDPNDDKRVFMSTGQYNSADGSGRLYISTDRGDHWQQKVDLPFSVGSNDGGRGIGERMMVDPNMPSTLFYGSRTAGLWKSADTGKTWNQVTSLSSTKMTSAQIGASNGSGKGVELVVFDTSTKGSGTPTSTIYTAIAPDYASAAGLGFNLYKSTNGGASWFGVPTPVTGFHIPHMVRAADGMFYVAFTKESGPGAGGPASLYKFDGSNWTQLKNIVPDQWSSWGMGGLSVYGTGATTRIALGITNSWGNWSGQPIVALSNDAGKTWREIASTMPHTPASNGFSGWIDDVEIDPSNPDHILHVFGGGVWSTSNASSATPSWTFAVDGLEETANVSLTTPPAGATYTLLNSSMDVGLLVHTDLTKTPTYGPTGDLAFGTAFSADIAWADPSYIAAVGNTTSKGSFGSYSTDAGRTWTAFWSNHPDAQANQAGETNIAVTKRNNSIWAVANSVPRYTADNGATWVPTNLPAIPVVGAGVNRSYRLAADRKNPNKVYAYDSGGAWWTNTNGKFYRSVDGGHTFTLVTNSTVSALRANFFQVSSLAVNPNAEGDVWLADGNSLYHSVDSGVTWTKLNAMQSVWGANPTWKFPELFGASAVALGKAAPGSSYSAAVYIVGTVGGVWGVHRSDDAGATWVRVNDDQHQYGGIGTLAADQNVFGRFYIAGGGRGVIYRN